MTRTEPQCSVTFPSSSGTLNRPTFGFTPLARRGVPHFRPCPTLIILFEFILNVGQSTFAPQHQIQRLRLSRGRTFIFLLCESCRGDFVTPRDRNRLASVAGCHVLEAAQRRCTRTWKVIGQRAPHEHVAFAPNASTRPSTWTVTPGATPKSDPSSVMSVGSGIVGSQSSRSPNPRGPAA